MTPADRVRDALNALLDRAGVYRLTDGPLTARGKVLRFLDAEGVVGRASDPEECPLAVWLRRETGFRVLLTPSRVVIPRVWAGSKSRIVVVNMPPALADAIKEIDALRVPWLTEEGKGAA